MKTKKRIIPWIIMGIVVLLVLGTVLVVEYFGKKKNEIGFPRDGVEATLKLGSQGYFVETEDNPLALQTLANDASNMYDISFFGGMTAYLEVYGEESKTAMKAQIFYFEHNADAKMLYEAMLKTWKYEKEEGEIRYKDKTIYMGYGEVLDRFED